SLENSSLLLADKDKPASGDLGLLIKARDDRDRLIAALYENARYGGIVNVTVAGKNVDDLPPNPVFDH
ncbi:outer membrane protein assembly factor, partial [Rhizobium sp. BR5]